MKVKWKNGIAKVGQFVLVVGKFDEEKRWYGYIKTDVPSDDLWCREHFKTETKAIIAAEAALYKIVAKPYRILSDS
jgi:hypothetical protein